MNNWVTPSPTGFSKAVLFLGGQRVPGITTLRESVRPRPSFEQRRRKAAPDTVYGRTRTPLLDVECPGLRPELQLFQTLALRHTDQQDVTCGYYIPGRSNVYRTPAGTTVSIPAGTAGLMRRVTFAGTTLPTFGIRSGITAGYAIEIGTVKYVIEQIHEDGSVWVTSKSTAKVDPVAFTISELDMRRSTFNVKVAEFDYWDMRAGDTPATVMQLDPRTFPTWEIGQIS